MRTQETEVWEDLITSLDSLDSNPTQTALETASAAVETAVTVFGKNHRNTATSLERKGEILHAMGDLQGAELAFKEALEIFNGTIPPDVTAKSRLTRSLGALCEIQGREPEAMGYYDQAIPLLEKIHGPTHPGLLTLLNNTALMHKAAGELDESERLFKHALRISEKMHRLEHSDQALLLNNLGNLHTARGDYDQGEVLLRRALTMRENLFGPNHPDVAQSVSNIAVVHHYAGNTKQARKSYERALNILLKQSSLDADEIEIVTSNLCTLLRQIGADDEAARVQAHIDEFVTPSPVSEA